MNVSTISNDLAKRIAINDDPEDLEVLNYGLEGIISSVLNTIIALIISIITGTILEFLMLCFIFIPIRCMHKGYHCTTFLSCVLYSNIMIAIATYILQMMTFQTWMYIGILIVVTLHYYVSIEKYKAINITIILAFYICAFINIQIASCIFLSIILNIILILGRKLHEK